MKLQSQHSTRLSNRSLNCFASNDKIGKMTSKFCGSLRSRISVMSSRFLVHVLYGSADLWPIANHTYFQKSEKSARWVIIAIAFLEKPRIAIALFGKTNNRNRNSNFCIVHNPSRKESLVAASLVGISRQKVWTTSLLHHAWSNVQLSP